MYLDHLLNRNLRCRLIPVTRAAQNCSLIWCADSLKAAVIDPGGDIHLILKAVEEEGLSVETLLVTHGHVDHAGGAAELSRTLAVPIDGPHMGDETLIEKMGEQGELYGFEGEPYSPRRWLEDGDQLVIGKQVLTPIHCPGHTAGSIVYFSEEARIAFVGDILFKGTIGATKSPRDHLQLLKNIRLRLLSLGDDVLFVPGHNEVSTFGHERKYNSAVSDKAAREYEHFFTDPRFN